MVCLFDLIKIFLFFFSFFMEEASLFLIVNFHKLNSDNNSCSLF